MYHDCGGDDDLMMMIIMMMNIHLVIRFITYPSFSPINFVYHLSIHPSIDPLIHLFISQYSPIALQYTGT